MLGRRPAPVGGLDVLKAAVARIAYQTGTSWVYDGATLTTASGGTIQVDVVGRCFISLVDADPTDRNPYVVRPNLNKGNAQIAHGISEVLRPLDL